MSLLLALMLIALCLRDFVAYFPARPGRVLATWLVLWILYAAVS